MRRLALGLAVIASTALVQLCTGCSGAVHVVVHGDQDRAREALEGAQELLGVPLELSDRGPVVVDMVEVMPLEETGRRIRQRVCSRWLRSTYDPVTLAHELGHAFGLDHVSDPANLMAPYTGDDTLGLTEGQRETVERRARALAGCP